MSKQGIPEQIPSVSEMIKEGVEHNRPTVSQREKAIEIGYGPDKVSMLSMIKRGTSKLSLGRVAKTAQVLELDPVMLLAAVLKEKTKEDPQAWELIRKTLNRTYSEDEEPYILAIRNVEKKLGRKVPINDIAQQKLEEFIELELAI